MLFFDSGDLDEARNSFEQGLRSSQQHQEYFMEAVCRMWLGRTLAKAHPLQAEEAEKEIRRGIEMAEERQIRPFVAYGYSFLGELYASRGEREKALEHLKKAIGMYQEMGMDYWLPQAQAALAKLES
jgi:tetratricopeptide (TPR) repeat protein